MHCEGKITIIGRMHECNGILFEHEQYTEKVSYCISIG